MELTHSPISLPSPHLSSKDVMETQNLGPNGGLVYCMEYLEQNLDWLFQRLEALQGKRYVLFDFPGQVRVCMCVCGGVGVACVCIYMKNRRGTDKERLPSPLLIHLLVAFRTLAHTPSPLPSPLPFSPRLPQHTLKTGGAVHARRDSTTPIEAPGEVGMPPDCRAPH